MSEIRRYTVSSEEDGIRLDRWFKIHFPQVTFAYLNKLTRTGQVRVGGGRVKTSSRLVAEQEIRVPPLAFDRRPADAPKGDVPPLTKEETQLFESMVIFEDKDLYVLNKPPGFAVQGGSNIIPALAECTQQRRLAAIVPTSPHHLRRRTEPERQILKVLAPRQA